MHPFLEGLKPTLHISHRGGSLLYPENTLPAFHGARETYRTDVLELDLHATRDGHLVVAHDPTVDRCTNGTGLIRDFTLAQLQALDAGFRFTALDGSHPFRGQGVVIPTFDALLAAFPNVKLNVELKTPDALAPFVRLFTERRLESWICCGAELDDLATLIAEQLPHACLFYPRDALASVVLPVMAGELPENDARFTVLDMPLHWEGLRLFTPALRDAAATLGKWINLWTVNDEAEMRALKAEGAGGVMTDRPDLLRQVLG